jgi:hypothetical protein
MFMNKISFTSWKNHESDNVVFLGMREVVKTEFAINYAVKSENREKKGSM